MSPLIKGDKDVLLKDISNPNRNLSKINDKDKHLP